MRQEVGQDGCCRPRVDVFVQDRPDRLERDGEADDREGDEVSARGRRPRRRRRREGRVGSREEAGLDGPDGLVDGDKECLAAGGEGEVQNVGWEREGRRRCDTKSERTGGRVSAVRVVDEMRLNGRSCRRFEAFGACGKASASAHAREAEARSFPKLRQCIRLSYAIFGSR